jgi:hypothetical protein
LRTLYLVRLLPFLGRAVGTFPTSPFSPAGGPPVSKRGPHDPWVEGERRHKARVQEENRAPWVAHHAKMSDLFYAAARWHHSERRKYELLLIENLHPDDRLQSNRSRVVEVDADPGSGTVHVNADPGGPPEAA